MTDSDILFWISWIPGNDAFLDFLETIGVEKEVTEKISNGEFVESPSEPSQPSEHQININMSESLCGPFERRFCPIVNYVELCCCEHVGVFVDSWGLES